MAHTYAKHLYHCIFSTKDRRGCIDPPIRERLYGYIGGILRQRGGRLVKTGGTCDHVHLLIELGSAISIADAMRLVKANSSKWMHQNFPENARFDWQTGYAAFTVSSSAVDNVVRYIERQEEHHRTTTFADELAEFLNRHKIEYDEHYVRS